MKDGEVFGLTHREISLLLEQAGFRILYEKRFMLTVNRLTIAVKAASKPEFVELPPKSHFSGRPIAVGELDR